MLDGHQSKPKRKSRKSKYPHGSPRDPKRVGAIVWLRDKEKLSWEQIRKKVGGSRQGPYLLYLRWKLGRKPPKPKKKEAS